MKTLNQFFKLKPLQQCDVWGMSDNELIAEFMGFPHERDHPRPHDRTPLGIAETLFEYAMREIKFRVWHKRLEEMLKPNQWNGYGPRLINGVIESDDHEIMQFTGLKDKNGKEIYEDDSLKCTTDKDPVFGSEQYIFFVEYWRDGFYLSTPAGKFALHKALETFKSVEITGNRYENPELLK